MGTVNIDPFTGERKFTQESYPSVLSDITIKEYMEDGLLIESPIRPEQMQPNSVDLTLGNSFKILLPNGELFNNYGDHSEFVPCIDPHNEMQYHEGTFQEYIVIEPGKFILLASKEVLNIPNGILSFVQGRSSVARMAIQTEQAGLIDAGFHGTITFEVFNQSEYPIKLYENMRIAQVYFFHAQVADQTYGKDKGSKYSNQIEATGSKIHMDAEIAFCRDESQRSKNARAAVKEYMDCVFRIAEHDYGVMVTGRDRNTKRRITYDVRDDGTVSRVFI